jgi:hypothetical protein
MSALDRQRQIELKIGKMFINAIGVDSGKFRNEVHFVSFLAIVATRNGIEGSNFNI